jgi:hypothetical protein
VASWPNAVRPQISPSQSPETSVYLLPDGTLIISDVTKVPLQHIVSFLNATGHRNVNVGCFKPRDSCAIPGLNATSVDILYSVAPPDKRQGKLIS